MAKFSSVTASSAIAGLTAEQVKIICADRDDDETRKAAVRREREVTQSRFAAVLALKAERAGDFAVRQKAEWTRRAVKRHVNDEQVKLRLANIRDFDYQRKLHFIAAFRDRDRARAVKAEQTKQAKLTAKRENQVTRYRKIVDLQATTRATNEACIMSKSGNTAITAKPIKSDIEENVGSESKSLDQCSYTMVHDPVKTDETAHEEANEAVDQRKFGQHDSFRTMILDRINKLKRNFTTCQQGEAFWNKTGPLWNRMKQCLEEKKTPPVQEPEWVPIEYQNKESELVMVNATDVQGPTLIQQIMLNNVDYGMGDDSVLIDMMIRAKELLGPGATAEDVILLTRSIVEHEADIKANVQYMVYGLAERGIFEYTKKRIAAKIFVDARKSVDRLRHVNDIGVIPNKLIKSKNKPEVTAVAKDLVINDQLYGKFDRVLDDDTHYRALVSETAADRIRTFLAGKLTETNPIILHQMERRLRLFADVDETVAEFLGVTHDKISHYVATSKTNDLKYDGTSAVSMCMLYRISRKLVKLVLGRFRTEERKNHNFWATVNAYMRLLSKRCPCVTYDRREFKVAEKIDINYFRKLSRDMDPRNRDTVPHSSFC